MTTGSTCRPALAAAPMTASYTEKSKRPGAVSTRAHEKGWRTSPTCASRIAAATATGSALLPRSSSSL